jgi:hypothetical protein
MEMDRSGAFAPSRFWVVPNPSMTELQSHRESMQNLTFRLMEAGPAAPQNGISLSGAAGPASIMAASIRLLGKPDSETVIARPGGAGKTVG